MAESAVDSGLYCMATPLAVSRGYGTQNSAPMMHQHGGSLELTVPPAHSLLSQAGLDREGLQSRGEDHSRLPPFQSFIGELERRSPM